MGDVAASLDIRFVEALDRLVPAFASNGQKLGLAVSGGPDSLALLLLASEACPGRVAAATVDHGLRPAARTEAEFVAAICRERGIPHEILRPVIPIRGSIQSAARHARYGLLHDWMKEEHIHWLATAHHADDQLETMIMRILRGSGIDGMSGIREKRTDIIRPLLHFQKSELVAYVANQGLDAVDDPSNRDQGFDRVRVRNALQDLEGFDTRSSGSPPTISQPRTSVALSRTSTFLTSFNGGCCSNACTFVILLYPRAATRLTRQSSLWKRAKPSHSATYCAGAERSGASSLHRSAATADFLPQLSCQGAPITLIGKNIGLHIVIRRKNTIFTA